MKHFRKIWNEDTNGFILANKEMRFDYQKFYSAFIEQFPDSEVSYTAFKNQVSRLGIADRAKSTHNSRTIRPLWSEQVKKGYVRIKIAQPNVWVSKAKWIYMETHPWEDFSERSNYVFLDGNSRNFDPKNIERVPLRCMGQFNLIGGCEKGNPGVTKLRILMAKEKMARFDLGEKLGLTANGGNGRVFKESRNARQREYSKRITADDKRREARNKTVRAYLERKRNDPAWVEAQRSYYREYARKKRAEK